jgi:hypothetical protein
VIIENAIARYYAAVNDGVAQLFGAARPDDRGFDPGIDLPELTASMRQYLSVSDVAFEQLGTYRGHRLSLLDLTRNPGTGTTKTFASLIMVARAVRYVQDTGQRVTLITPSSANKAIALRDAVLRAITSGLVTADQLNVVVLVPAGSMPKLRRSELFTDPELRARNPVGIYTGPHPEAVKTISRTTLDRHRLSLERDTKTRLWYTLRLENYLVGDLLRALAEAEYWPADPDRPRLHAHAVSSAYGLLGHAFGRETLGAKAPGRPSRYFLVQHLGAPDMVRSLYDGAPAAVQPEYVFDEETGLYTQSGNPHFPQTTFDPAELLDTTFYTRNPATSSRMNELINEQGGGGIVVSLAECLERFAQVRALLNRVGLSIPANPTAILEWSLIMAMTGVLNAIDRGLVNEQDILVHGSGTYSHDAASGLGPSDLNLVDDDESFRDLIFGATAR